MPRPVDPTPDVKLTAIVLTKNEEAVIHRCLSALQWTDETLVVDSGSTDRTVVLAQASGARIESVSWQGWARQRVRATELAANDWVFFVDADEYVTDELQREIRSNLTSALSAETCLSVARRNEFMGVLLPNSERSRRGVGLVRIFNRTKSGYDPEELVHERVLPAGNVVSLVAPLLHWRPQTIDEQIERLNFYSNVEAEALQRRKLRGIYARLAFMPLLRFGWVFLIKAEWRFGARGFIHAGLKAIAEFARYSKLLESGLPKYATHPPQYLEQSIARRDVQANSDGRNQ